MIPRVDFECPNSRVGRDDIIPLWFVFAVFNLDAHLDKLRMGGNRFG